MPLPVPVALRDAAVRVYGPDASVRRTDHGGVEITDGWGTRRLTVVERSNTEAIRQAFTMLCARDSHGGRG